MSWWIWLVISLIIGIVELTTFTFVLLWIAIAGLLTTALTGVIPSLWVQVTLFAIVSVVLIAITRPIARRWKQKKTYPTHQETLRAQRGIVVTVASSTTYATVRVDGEVWSAKCEKPLHVGQEVIVLSSGSVVLEVEPVKGD